MKRNNSKLRTRTNALVERNKLIYEKYVRGESVIKLAKEYHLSRERIYAIVAWYDVFRRRKLPVEKPL